MLFVQIKNWKEVTDQFGFEMAKQISKSLSMEFERVSNDMDIDGVTHLSVPCVEKGEAIALFELQEWKPNYPIYEYTGTAN